LTGDEGTQDIDALKSIAATANISIPPMIEGLFNKAIAQQTLIDKEDIEKEILDFI